MKGLLVSPAAQADLIGIWEYTAERWSPEQADHYIRSFDEAFGDLAAGRKTGRDVPDIREGYFRLAVGSHFVFYRVASDFVDIIRVLHQRMDIPERLLR